MRFPCWSALVATGLSGCSSPSNGPKEVAAFDAGEVGTDALSDAAFESDRIPPASCLDRFGKNQEWESEEEVRIDGYVENAMEPKLSHDQVVLFWNDKPAEDSNMDLHYAVRQPNGHYEYVGPLSGAASPGALDGVPSLDEAGNFYFISTRTFSTNSQTIFAGQVQVEGLGKLSLGDVRAADDAIPKNGPGVLAMDVDVSSDGALAFASRATFSGKPFPDQSALALYRVSSRALAAHEASEALLRNVNSQECLVYAASLSRDLLELYYTVAPVGTLREDQFRIAVSKRASPDLPFQRGEIITAVAGKMTEGPSITHNDGGKYLLFHKKDPASGKFRVFRVRR